MTFAFIHAHSVRRLYPLYRASVSAKKFARVTDRDLAQAARRRLRRRPSSWEEIAQVPELSRTYLLEVDEDSAEGLRGALARLRSDPNVEFAEEDKLVSSTSVPNDPYLYSYNSWGQGRYCEDLYGLVLTSATINWSYGTGAGIVVAVIDTGIDFNHPDLAANVWTNTAEAPGNGVDDDGNGYVDDILGWNFVANNGDVADDNGHGTHVAGIIGAVGNNGIGMVGTAWQAKIMGLKALNSNGKGLDSNVAAAIRYAADNGADVISLSWAGLGTSQSVFDAISYAHDIGITVVAAAGDQNDNVLNYYPASFWNVITVGSLQTYDSSKKSTSSNWGARIDVSAPGEDILSILAAGTSFGIPLTSDYTRASGTSMSAAFGSGIAAMELSAHPDYSNEQVRQAIIMTKHSDMISAAAVRLARPIGCKISSPAEGAVLSSPTALRAIVSAVGPSTSYSTSYGPGVDAGGPFFIKFGFAPVSGSVGMFDASVLSPGPYTLYLDCQDNDAFNYVYEDRVHVTIAQGPATPVIAWADPATITYGTALSEAQLNATASVLGNFTFTPAAGAVVNAGVHVLSVTFTPNDTLNYTAATKTVTLTVNKATPVITWEDPQPITYGTVLSLDQLNATASVPGTLVYTPVVDSMPSVGICSLSVTFTPADTINFTSATRTVTLTVNKAAPAITWVDPAAIIYGTPLSPTQLNATSSLPGTFAYTPTPGTTLNAGSHRLFATFTPTDSLNYTTATRMVTLTVDKAVPVITWENPATISYGTLLSPVQLNATASIPGTLVYLPTVGTALNIGIQGLSVSFTPSDTLNYASTQFRVHISVDLALLLARPNRTNRSFALSSPLPVGYPAHEDPWLAQTPRVFPSISVLSNLRRYFFNTPASSWCGSALITTEGHQQTSRYRDSIEASEECKPKE